jgi:3-deoxy-D-manno-octulosonic acid (KDO) 8-phosphate synthase
MSIWPRDDSAERRARGPVKKVAKTGAGCALLDDPDTAVAVAAACVAAGADGVFVETHPDPSRALSDGANMLPLSLFPALLERLIHVFDAVRG